MQSKTAISVVFGNQPTRRLQSSFVCCCFVKIDKFFPPYITRTLMWNSLPLTRLGSLSKYLCITRLNSPFHVSRFRPRSCNGGVPSMFKTFYGQLAIALPHDQNPVFRLFQDPHCLSSGGPALCTRTMTENTTVAQHRLIATLRHNHSKNI